MFAAKWKSFKVFFYWITVILHKIKGLPPYIKHIFTFICVVLMAHLYVCGVSRDEMTFDPMDMTDNPVMMQGKDVISFNAGDLCEGNKAPGLLTSHKSNKKGSNSKFFSFDCVFVPAKKMSLFLAYSITKHLPVTAATYWYLFYKEINPPPPKFALV